MKRNLIKFFAFIFGIYLIVTSIKSILELHNAGNMGEETQKTLEDLRKKNGELKIKLAEVKSNDYIEKRAREDLNMSKQGEKVVILPGITPFNDKEEVVPQKEDLNYQKWYKLFF